MSIQSRMNSLLEGSEPTLGQILSDLKQLAHKRSQAARDLYTKARSGETLTGAEKAIVANGDKDARVIEDVVKQLERLSR